MSRVVHFEIFTDDPDRIAKFYAEALGWTVRDPVGPVKYWLISTGADGTPGINGGMSGDHFQQPVINTVEVPSLDEATAKIERAGGKRVFGPQTIPGVGTHSYFTDPAGTMFGVLERARTA